MIKLLDMQLEQYIQDALFEEDDASDIKLKMTTVSLKILFKEVNKYYQIIKIPEFDVS